MQKQPRSRVPSCPGHLRILTHAAAGTTGALITESQAWQEAGRTCVQCYGAPTPQLVRAWKRSQPCVGLTVQMQRRQRRECDSLRYGEMEQPRHPGVPQHVLSQGWNVQRGQLRCSCIKGGCQTLVAAQGAGEPRSLNWPQIRTRVQPACGSAANDLDG